MPAWWDGCDTVRCGFWINWNGGSVTGSTLTLPTQWGLILTAFIALFIKVVGGYLWGIICFALHQRSASPHPQDDTYHQFQNVLRNTDSETSFIWNLLKISAAHRGTRVDTIKRSSVMIFIAVLHGVGFSIAGGLSSRFVVASNEVQLLQGKCGWIKDAPFANISDSEAFEEANAQIVTVRNGYRSSSIYARNCYAGVEGKDTDCGTYVQDALQYTTTVDSPCPFDDKICNGKAISMDTGALRSDEDFGINTLAKDALSLYKQMTCAPLNGEDYSSGWFPTNRTGNYDIGTMVKGYKFGRNPLNDNFKEYTTMVAENLMTWGDLRYNLASSSHFQNYTGDKAALFDPIPELQTDDTDLSLIYLINRAAFRSPTKDPFLDAQNCTNETREAFDDIYLCRATHSMSFMGCVERYRLCTSDEKLCTPFNGVYALQQPPQGLNPTQAALYQVLWKMIWTSQLNLQIGLVGRDYLVANQYLWDNNFSFGISSDLPENHWHHEVANWMNTSLAVMQRSAASYARPEDFSSGSGNSSLKYIVEPEDPTMQLLCQKVKMRSSDFTSFSVVGLFVTFALGIFIVTANGVVPVLTAWWQRYTGKGAYKRLEWIESKAFQLQRMAAEGRGIGPWEGKDEDVPVLAQRGFKFNLTSQSLRGGDGLRGNHAYQGLAREESSPQSDAYELLRVDYKGRSRVSGEGKF